MFQTKFVENLKAKLLVQFFRISSCRLWDNVEKTRCDQTGYMWQYKVAQEKCKQIETHKLNTYCFMS